MQPAGSPDLQTPTPDDIRRLIEGVSALHTAAGHHRLEILAERALGLLGAKVVALFGGGVGGDLVRLEVRSAEAGRSYDPPTPDDDLRPGVELLSAEEDGPEGVRSAFVEGKRKTVLCAWRSRPFELRHVTLLQLFHPAVAWALAEPLDRATLPAGTEAVLELMLTGLPEKEIARKLGRSTHTIHSHVKRVYKHFKVSSRPELMVRLCKTRR